MHTGPLQPLLPDVMEPLLLLQQLRQHPLPHPPLRLLQQRLLQHQHQLLPQLLWRQRRLPPKLLTLLMRFLTLTRLC